VHEKKRAKEKGKKRKVTLGSRLVSHVSTNLALVSKRTRADDYRIADPPRLLGARKKEGQRKGKKTQGKGKKRKVTLGSRLVSHVSTNNAQRCLTSLIGREAVFPPWYEPCIQVGALFVNTNSTSTHLYSYSPSLPISFVAVHLFRTWWSAANGFGGGSPAWNTRSPALLFQRVTRVLHHQQHFNGSDVVPRDELSQHMSLLALCPQLGRRVLRDVRD
jgi:hypothetical protein